MCNSTYGLSYAHAIVPRSKGGLGVRENGCVLCLKCHHKLDNGKDSEHKIIKDAVEIYMNFHETIIIEDLIYDKFKWAKF